VEFFSDEKLMENSLVSFWREIDEKSARMAVFSTKNNSGGP